MKSTRGAVSVCFKELPELDCFAEAPERQYWQPFWQGGPADPAELVRASRLPCGVVYDAKRVS